MEFQKYSDYFEVDEGYYPEINESSIKDLANKWQKTFPHEQIVKIFELLEKVLSRGTNEYKKNIWIHGSYGTGKSRVLWTLKNLLDCPAEEFIAYFDSYSSLKDKTDLRDRILAAKARKIVTVNRYATGGIKTVRDLVREVFDSIESALRRDGYKFSGEKTLRGKIAAWLEADDANLQLFRAKIQKPKYSQLGSFAGKSAENILAQLKNPKIKVSALVEDILNLGEAEGIRAFEIKMDDLVSWIAEVIAENDLKAIVFFWDEFSSFFKQHRTSLDEFQKLVELSNETPFCMVIATQKAEDLLSARDAAFKTVRDRFKQIEISMPDNVAFDLIAEALKIKPEAKAEWTQLVEDLSERTKKSRGKVKALLGKAAGSMSEKNIIRLLPIHPMAALMLKNISTSFASNQRSMFNFIKEKNPDEGAVFQQFIETNSPHDGALLTIDCLWDFFYVKGRDEHTSLIGRDNLEGNVRIILDSYGTYEKNLDVEERQVLKTVLMLQAMSRSAKDNVDLFLPSAENIDLAFEGVDNLENGRAVSIAKNLVEKNVLFLNAGKVPTFAVMATSVDVAEVKELEDRIEKNLRTLTLASNGKFLDFIMLDLTSSQKFRYQISLVAPENFTTKINLLSKSVQDFHINTVVCFARDEVEREKISRLLRDALKDSRYNQIVFVDATANLMGEENIRRYIETAAREEYWREKDSALSREMEDKKKACLDEWKSSVRQFVIYHSTKSDVRDSGVNCLDAQALQRELKSNVLENYPLSFDNVEVAEALFQQSQLSKGVNLGISESTGGVFGKEPIQAILREVWHKENDYWKVQPDLQISMLKVLVDQFIVTKLKQEVRVDFDEIWKLLQKNGFMPCNLYAYLTGFLLKEYSHEPYRYSEGVDGFKGGTLNVENFSKFVAESMAGKTSREPKFLELMSKNQRAFISFAHKTFGIDKDSSVENGASKIRTRITSLNYPIWCYAENAADEYRNFFKDFEQLNNPKGQNLSALAESMGKFLLEETSRSAQLQKYFSKDAARAALENFLSRLDDGIIFQLEKELGLNDVVAEVQNQLAHEDKAWLWDKETALGTTERLIVEYRIIAASRKLEVDCNSWRTCLEKWKSKVTFIKIPCAVIAEHYPSLKNFFAGLKEIVVDGEPYRDRQKIFLQQLEDYPAEIRGALTNSWKVLREKYSEQLAGLSDDDTKKICAMLPGSFTAGLETFHQNLTSTVEKFKRDQAKFKLKNLWKDVTQSDSPCDWSKKFLTPIFALVPEAEKANAQKVFEAVSFSNPEDWKVNFALEYLEREPKWLKVFNDKEKIDKAFTRSIIGEYKVLLTDIDEVRKTLLQKVSPEVYDWLFTHREKVERTIERLAEDKYKNGGANDMLVQKVQQMSDAKAKEYLIKLLRENYKVGLQILTEEI